MNTLFHNCAWQSRLASRVRALFGVWVAGLLLANAPALAAPGAHGPNGEHLDAPTGMRAAAALPRVEAKSETFEVVAELRAGELAILVDRYETNEPVLGAKLDVDSGTLKAVATFRAEQGDYVVTDAALLKLLATPGEHGLVFTLVAGQESDLIDATFVSGAGRTVAAATQDGHGHSHAGDDHGHDHSWERAAWIAATVAALGLIGAIAWWRQRGRQARLPRGAL
jgi:hypothetical protein